LGEFCSSTRGSAPHFPAPLNPPPPWSRIRFFFLHTCGFFFFYSDFPRVFILCNLSELPGASEGTPIFSLVQVPFFQKTPLSPSASRLSFLLSVVVFFPGGCQSPPSSPDRRLLFSPEPLFSEPFSGARLNSFLRSSRKCILLPWNPHFFFSLGRLLEVCNPIPYEQFHGRIFCLSYLVLFPPGPTSVDVFSWRSVLSGLTSLSSVSLPKPPSCPLCLDCTFSSWNFGSLCFRDPPSLIPRRFAFSVFFQPMFFV